MTESTQSNRTGRKPSTPISREAVELALYEVMTRPWVEVSTMQTVLGVSHQSAYREAQAGRFGAFRVGNLYRVPTAPLREILHLQPVVAEPAHEAA